MPSYEGCLLEPVCRVDNSPQGWGLTDIKVVPAEAYLAGVNVVHENDDCLTHVARVHHPGFGARLFYLKHYPENPLISRGLANEVCGYLLASAAGLPVPSNPLIIALPRERLTEVHPQYAHRLRNDVLFAWATEETGGSPLPADLEFAGAALRKWQYVGDLVAFDTWAAIPDRTPRNLARRRNRQITVIDHGHLGGSVRWIPDLLPVDEDRRHPFLDLWPSGQVPDEVNQRIMVAAEQHPACMQRIAPELNHWMGRLMANSGDTMALVDFLTKRADASQARMRRILELLV